MGDKAMIFNRFDPFYRSPVGAVKAETEVSFSLTLPRNLGIKKVTAEITLDGTNEKNTVSLEWTSLVKNREVYSGKFLFDKEGLYWYTFLIECEENTLRLSENGRGEALRREDEYFVPFQQTVYKKEFVTPDWLNEGVMYQIFPDRFYSSKKKESCLSKGRYVHESWNDAPDFDNDPLKITNSDFFGGDLRGIAEKLPYIASLGVKVIYLNPIFEAFSNHRYDTGDYSKIDPLLGTEEDFVFLCEKAREYGIRIILDGVFSHTGADSKYFNLKGNYDSVGASQSKDSPYYSWYDFERFPDKYTCWWGVWSLPCVNETDKGFLEYITGENGIAKKYLRLGASGWRLDVADELPDGFLDAFRKAVKEEKTDAAIIGEVWEDASNKTAYSERRRYLLGDQLDSVMNYPFSNAIKDFAKNGNSKAFADTVMCICEHYPAPVLNCLMNMISTHDTQRALTALSGESVDGHDRNWQSKTSIPNEKRAEAVGLLKLAAVLQYTLPGIPSLYYGDEAGIEGYGDPFNRGTFPWGNEDRELTEFFASLGKLRNDGDWTSAPFELLYEDNGVIAYKRKNITVLVNGREEEAKVLGRLLDKKTALILKGNKTVLTSAG